MQQPLIQLKFPPAARLPFKRLNPEPKENQPPKRLCAHACPEPAALDRENESSALPVHNGPPLVNGRGPLDGFLSRRSPAPSNENTVIDLTTDDTLSPIKRLASSTPASACLSTKDKNRDKGEKASPEKPTNVDHTSETKTLECTVVDKDENAEDVEEQEGNQTASISQSDITQDSESEPEEQNESENVSSLGNKSMLSNSSVSSSSESSPEKTDDPTPTKTPTVRCVSLFLVLI